MSENPIIQIKPLGFPWETLDPFLFCVYHDDAYPKANPNMGPAASLTGREIGQDFARKDGWSMYHGRTIPGFPAHPHRGFETVTIVRKGLIDHSDSLGAKARFGQGDVQWLTAGKGVVHAEMFPLLNQAETNPLELFQIWLNLPACSKMVDPHFTMLWSDAIPHRTHGNMATGRTDIAVIAGQFDPNSSGTVQTEAASLDPLAPPPDSWAAQADADVAIWTIRMTPGARFTLPAATGKNTRRMVYAFKDAAITVAGQSVQGTRAIEVRASAAVELVNAEPAGGRDAEFLLLQGRPIGEPVVQHGPFVMNTAAEINQTIRDYQRTQFGGWPWPDQAPVHGRESERFALHPGGREERPQTK